MTHCESLAAKLAAQAFANWAPPPRLTISEWADTYRVVAQGTSPEPGQWATRRTPYLKEPMDALGELEEIVICFSSQVGKSETAFNAIGYFAHQDPAPQLYVAPTVEMAESFSKERIAPMFRESPALRGLLDDKSRDGNNTILSKLYPGGTLNLCGANSPASLASRPCRIVICDEVDKYPASAGDAGDPISLAQQRAQNFWNRRMLLISTPTIKGASRIWSAFEATDQRRYFVPCPHCGAWDYLKWAQVKWESGQPHTARYECEHCGKKLGDAQVNAAVRRGEWRPTATPKPGHESSRGFHLWALYSPWVGLAQLASSFLKAKSNPVQLQQFVNEKLGECWDDPTAEELDWQRIAGQALPYKPLELPEQALLLTAGIDVQADRLAISLWAWGEQERGWLIYHQELWGDPLEPAVWASLSALLTAEYDHASLSPFPVAMAAIDTGFETQAVYGFCRANPTLRLIPVKGISGFDKPIIGKPTYQEVTLSGKKIRRGIQLWPLGVDTIKSLVYGRLSLPQPNLHTPIGLGEDYYLQLTAERKQTTYHKGFSRLSWVKVRHRNEALDCLIYAYAAAQAVGLSRANWQQIRDKKLQKDTEDKGNKTKPSSTGWIGHTTGGWM